MTPGTLGLQLGAATPGGEPLAAEGFPLAFGGAGPDAGTLVGLEGVLETTLGYCAHRADSSGSFDRWGGCVRSGEEEGVGVSPAGRLVLPIGDEVLGGAEPTLGHTTIVAVRPDPDKTS